MPKPSGFLHLNLNVSSIDASVRFYCDALGFVIIDTSEEIVDLGSGPEPIRQTILTIPSSGTILALTQAASFEVGGHGLNHLGLIVHSDSACRSILGRVENLGGSIQKRGTREESGVSEEFAYIRDPDGYAVELSTQAILYTRFPELRRGA